MNCGEARFSLAADPSARTAALTGHLESCASCAAYARDMQALDLRLRDAMAISVPAIPLPARPRRLFNRPLALAASLAGVAVLAGLLWIGVPRPSLATAVVAHMAEEPNSWETTGAVSGDAVTRVLSRSGIALNPGSPEVTYASSCWFRGHHVPHLVVQTPEGPVTVMVLPHESVDRAVEFQEGGYRGMLVPAERGAIAVLTRDAASVDRLAAIAVAAIDYLD
jgi:hypothetical protein